MRYEDPIIKVIKFESADVITTSIAEVDHDNTSQNAGSIGGGDYGFAL